MASGLMCRALVTAKESTVKSPTKASASATPDAVVTLQQPEPLASQSKPVAGPAAHNRRLWHVFGLTVAGSPIPHAPRPPAPPATKIRQTRPVFIPRPPGRATHRRSLASSQSSPSTQAPSLPDPASEPRLLTSIPGPPSPPEPSHPRPPASLPRPPGHRSSKTSLGFISTPLIWQGRKRPTGGKRPAATRAPPMPMVHITKPAAQPTELNFTARPTYTTQTSVFKHTDGYTNATHMLGYATHTAARLHSSAQPTSRPNFSHQPVSNKENPTNTQDSKFSPESGVSISSQGSPPWQRRDEVLDTKESSSAVGAAPLASSSSLLLSSLSALNSRKNKPVAPQWSLLSMSGGANQTIAMGNRTHPLEPLGDEYSSGSEPFVYDLTELTEEGGAFSLYEFDAAYSLDEPTTIPPAFIGPDAKNEQSFNRSDPQGAFLPVTNPLTASEGGSEVLAQTHFHDDSETLASGLGAGSKLSLTHSYRLMPETVTLISRSQTPTCSVCIVESAHIPELDGVSRNFQPSVLSSLSLSPNLQRDFVVTRVDTASSLSLPFFSKAQTESQMPVVDGALLPEYHFHSAEESSNNTSEPFRSRLPNSEGNQLLDTQSGLFVHSVGIFLDSSFSQIEPTPSGLSMENLASSTAVLELLDPELGSSVVLWPSSHAASQSVRQFLVHSDQRDLSDIYILPDESRQVHQSAIGFTSLPTAGIWASELTPALLQAYTDRTQRLHSASLSTISSSSSNPVLSTWSPLSHHLDNLSLTVSSETLTAMQVARMTEQMVGEETVVSSSSPSPNSVVENSLLLAHTSSSGSHDRYTSSLTFKKDPWRLKHTISHLHTNNQVNTNTTAGAHATSRGSQALAGYDDAFNHPTSLFSNPSVMATTQTLALHSSSSAQLNTATPQHASGLDYMHHSGLTQTNTEHRGRLIHTHSSAHTHLGAQAHASKFLDASEKLNSSQRPGQDTQNAAAHVDVGEQLQSSHLISFAPAPPLLSASILPSLSLAATLTPPFPSLQLSPVYPAISPYITASSLSLSSFITPSLSPLPPSWVVMPVVSASMEEAEIGSLSPSWPTAGFHQPTTTQSPLDNHLQSFQRSTTYHVSQSIESIQQFITVSQSLPLDQAFALPDDKLKYNHSKPLVSAKEHDKDKALPQLANISQTVSSPEASNNLTAVGKLSHLSALFDPTDVVPKIHIADEHASTVGLASSAVNTNDNVTLYVMLSAPTAHQPNENLNPEAAMITQSFPVEIQTTSPCPTSEPSYRPSSAVANQPTGAPVIPNPLHTSGLNIPSSTPASRYPTGSSIDASSQGFISAFEGLPPPRRDNRTANTAGLKYISMSNATTIKTLKDSPSVSIEMTNTTKAKNATTVIENGRIEASQEKKPTPDLSVKAGTSANSNLTISKPSLNSSQSVSNHSGNQSSGVFVNGAVNPDQSYKDVLLSPTLPVVVNAHHFITTKNSSPTAPFKADSMSASSGGSSSLKKATVRPTAVDLAARPVLPCRCKQRFHFTCLCGLSSGNKDLFYRISFVVDDESAALPQAEVERAVALWLNQTFQSWTHAVNVDFISVQPGLQSGGNPGSYTCQALLVYHYITNESLGEAAVSARLSSREVLMGAGLQIQPASTDVRLIENCPEENPLHYRWPESRPTVTRYLPCFPNKDQSTSRTCSISPQNYSSYWSPADLSNCTDIDTIQVSAENAAEVAVQLANIPYNELSNEEVSIVVTKVKQLVNVAKINSTLASIVVTIISNVMTSSETVLAATSEKALKTVDELVQKLEFEGPSIHITSRHLALGISALNTTVFNGTSFSAFMAPNTTDPQIDFESERLNPLAQVTLPASLLSNVSLSDADRSSLSRINFMFFSSTNLFQKEQDGRSLNSYVVASSVGNFSISNLMDPVEIEIAHLSDQPYLTPVCMFWDFSMNNGAGGWNGKGCRTSKESTRNTTICYCDHLTHFGILMDISGASPHIDSKNNKILTFITYIGCGISAIFSAATLLTYIAFEKLRRDYPSKILMNLSTSLLFLNMVFLFDGWLASLETDWLCLSVAVFLHYFLLTSFTWMGLESIHMYIALVKVFNTYIRRYILKFCIVGWGLPAVLVGIVVAVDKNSYGLQEYGKGEPGEGSSEFCWIKNSVVFYITCVGYFCLVFLLNVAMFIVVMMQICGRNGKRSNRSLREEVLRNLRSVISLTFLLGMTWGFALFAWGPVNLAFMYLFSIFNSLQGLFIFIFHCALKENVQKQWRRYLCCGRFRLSDNSDWSKTATNNTKKVSSDNLGKSLSSSSFGSSTGNWTSKAKATFIPFTKRHSNTDKCYSNQTSPKCVSSSPSSSEVEPNSSSSSSSILPVSQMIDKVKGYCSTRSDNFYKNIIMSDSFAHSTRF